MSIARLDFLDREAALYKNARNTIDETSDFIQNQIDLGTKEEQEKVEKAIKELNSKVKTIIESKEVKDKEELIKDRTSKGGISIDSVIHGMVFKKNGLT